MNSTANTTSPHCRARPKRPKLRSGRETDLPCRCPDMCWEKYGGPAQNSSRHSTNTQPLRLCRRNCGTLSLGGESSMVAGRRSRHWERVTTRSAPIKKLYKSLRIPGHRFLRSVTALVILKTDTKFMSL